MIKLVNLKKSEKTKDLIVIYNTINVKSETVDFKLLISSQINVTRLSPSLQQEVLSKIDKIYNKNININLVPSPEPVKKRWWLF